MTETLRTLLVAVPCGVLSCLVTLWVADPSSSIPPPTDAGNEQVLLQLADLRQKIDDIRTAQPITAPATVRQPVFDVEPFIEQVNELLNRSGRLLAVAGSGANQPPVQRDLPIRWGELDSLKALGEEQWQTANASVVLMTPAEVIARFGSPTQVKTSDRYDMTWFYMRDEQSGIPDATIHFNGGYVVQGRFF